MCQSIGSPGWQLDQECGVLPTTTTTTTPPPVGRCEIYGDPHITTFDHWHTTNYVEGEFWLVKSNMVKIQAKYGGIPGTKQLSVMKALVIGGEFLRSYGGSTISKVVVLPNGAWLDGQKILGESPELQSYPQNKFKYGVVSGYFDHNGIRLQRGVEKEPMNVVHLVLPFGVNLTMNIWRLSTANNWINVHLEMPPVPGGQDGQCGNFNGNIDDDKRTQIQSRDAWLVPNDPNVRLFTEEYQPPGFRGKYRNIAITLSEACKEAIEEFCNWKYPSPNATGVGMQAHAQQDYDRNDCQHKYTFDEYLENTQCPNFKPALASPDGWVPHTLH